MTDVEDCQRVAETEPEGGNPPCWAHLFDDAADAEEELPRSGHDPPLAPCCGAGDIAQNRTD